MSSVLKALKKIEQEGSHDQKESSVWPDSIHSARKTLTKSSRTRLVVGGTLILCCFLIASVVYFGFKNGDKEPVISETKKEQLQLNVADDRQPERTPVSFVLNRSSNKFHPEIKKQTEMQGEVKDKSIIPVQEDTDASDMKFPEMEQVPTSPVTPEKNDELPDIKSDSRLEIQAIAWSSDPSRSFAVINNSIFREGGNVDGITVVHIEDNLIHFRENGKEWRQRFVIK